MSDRQLAVELLPTPIALHLYELETATNPFNGLWAACDLLEQTLRLLVMAGVAEHGGDLPEKLISAVRNEIRQPSVGSWVNIAITVADHLPLGTRMPQLPVTVAAIKNLWRAQGFRDLRNRMAHGAFSRQAESDIADLNPKLRPKLDTISDEERGKQCQSRGSAMSRS